MERDREISLSREREREQEEAEGELLYIIIGGKIRAVLRPPFTQEVIIPLIKQKLKEMRAGRNFILLYNGEVISPNFGVLERGGKLEVRGIDVAG